MQMRTLFHLIKNDRALCNGHAAEVATLRERILAEKAKSEQLMEQLKNELSSAKYDLTLTYTTKYSNVQLVGQ
jgi:hypothetical protein